MIDLPNALAAATVLTRRLKESRISMRRLLHRVWDKLGFNPLGWAIAVPRMRARVREFTAQAGVGQGEQRALVVVTPWLGTAIPWFSIGVGLMLSAEGVNVTFVVDDRRFGPGAIRHGIVLGAIRRVMQTVARTHSVIHLSSLTPVPNDDEADSEIARLARLNGTWAMRGEMVQEGRAAIEMRNREQIAAAYGQIGAVFRDHRFDFMFAPGGIFGSSGIWARHARAAGVRVSTYDAGGYETVMLAADGLACQLHDVPRAFRAIRAQEQGNVTLLNHALKIADEEIGKRQLGSDAFESQIKNSGSGGDELKGGILIALNSSWDAAALGLHVVYPSNTDWIIGTVRYLLDNTNVPVIVRQHPAERLDFASTSDDYRTLLSSEFGAHPRLHFIAAEDPINSYALMGQVRAVVAHSSTIGIEAAAFGLPVITGSAAYYSELNFVCRADDLENYHQLLNQAANGSLTVSPQAREDARVCFYVTQCCNWIFSTFNAGDYQRWRERSLDHWRNQPSVQRMLRAIIDNVPVAVLNHQAAVADLSPVKA